MRLRTRLYRLWLRLFERGRTLDDLERWLGLERGTIHDVPREYSQFQVPKRSGGQRTISVPCPQLKHVQRTILRKLLTKLEVHPAATGFESGKSIVHNALPHCRQALVLKLDIVDFFPATRRDRLTRMFLRLGWTRSASLELSSLCTHQGGLPQGASTSPRLSNVVNVSMDRRISELAADLGAVYTRYADDLTFSFASTDRFEVYMLIEELWLIIISYGYMLHARKKVSLRGRHQRQTVTGLTVNDRPQLSRQQRRKLRAIRHHLKTGRPATMTRAQLAGWDSLESMIREQSAGSQNN